MRLQVARAVADAVLLEGYALYPFRASAPKNRFRWAFGVLAPQAWSEAGGCERWWLESQVLVTGKRPVHLTGHLRFFQIERRHVEQHDGAHVDALEVDGNLVVGWDEGVLRTVDIDLVVGGTLDRRFTIDGGYDVERLGASGRVVRDRRPLTGRITVESVPVDEAGELTRMIIRVENITTWEFLDTSRDQTMTAAFASTHLLLAATGGEFVSLLDPPEWAREAAAACVNVGTYPVIASPDDECDVVLSSPIILYDHPQIAPESHGDFCDATEVDELLTLRTLTLTDEEKREARATDPRAAEIVDRVDALPTEWLARLHGAARDVRNAEMTPRVEFTPGCRVRLRPGPNTDAQDLLYAGMIATVVEIRHDVDGRDYLAVTIDDDPAAELHHWYGRYHHYRTDEVELVPEDV